MRSHLLLVFSFTLALVQAQPAIKVGADRILESPYFHWIEGKRIGLITNQTGVNKNLEYVSEIFQKSDEVRLVALFGPEHGITGAAQDGEKIESGPVAYSLYGDTHAPTPEMLRDVEVLVYDIQDVGVRFYTFISTMFESMKAASRHGIPFIVLDRPNPIDGTRVSGPILERGRESFVGIHPIPIRYGMTVGEIAQLLRDEADIALDLRIVPMEGWRRKSWFDDYALDWIAPSPNMPTLDTATLYPGFCLIEGTNLSEGRGTTRPFEVIGSPWLDAETLVERMNSLNLSGVRFRVLGFIPVISKYAGEMCHGIQVHILNRNEFDPLTAALHLVRTVRQLHPDKFEFRQSSWDRLAGNSWIREMLENEAEVSEISQRWEGELWEFTKRREKYLIY